MAEAKSTATVLRRDHFNIEAHRTHVRSRIQLGIVCWIGCSWLATCEDVRGIRFKMLALAVDVSTLDLELAAT